MKKMTLLAISLVLLFGVFAAIPAAAEESDMYYVNVQILKIFPHRLGYYVIYRRAGLKTGEIYIPKEWLDRRDARAVLNLVESDVNPYLTFVLKGGEFNHVRISAARDINHPTWGMMPQDGGVAERFKVDTVKLEF